MATMDNAVHCARFEPFPPNLKPSSPATGRGSGAPPPEGGWYGRYSGGQCVRSIVPCGAKLFALASGQ